MGVDYRAVAGYGVIDEHDIIKDVVLEFLRIRYDDNDIVDIDIEYDIEEYFDSKNIKNLECKNVGCCYSGEVYILIRIKDPINKLDEGIKDLNELGFVINRGNLEFHEKLYVY